MKMQNRRKFLVTTSLLCTGLAASALFPKNNKANKQQVLHHVFFWLKNPGSKEDLTKLIDGLRTLKKIEGVRQMHIGIPALTESRPVIDNSYNATVLLFFDDLAGEKKYQVHPIHKKFIETCSQLWKKIVVYDSVDV